MGLLAKVDVTSKDDSSSRFLPNLIGKAANMLYVPENLVLNLFSKGASS